MNGYCPACKINVATCRFKKGKIVISDCYPCQQKRNKDVSLQNQITTALKDKYSKYMADEDFRPTPWNGGRGI